MLVRERPMDVCKQPRCSTDTVATGRRKAKMSPAVGDTAERSSIPRDDGRMLETLHPKRRRQQHLSANAIAA